MNPVASWKPLLPPRPPRRPEDLRLLLRHRESHTQAPAAVSTPAPIRLVAAALFPDRSSPNAIALLRSLDAVEWVRFIALKICGLARLWLSSFFRNPFRKMPQLWPVFIPKCVLRARFLIPIFAAFLILAMLMAFLFSRWSTLMAKTLLPSSAASEGFPQTKLSKSRAKSAPDWQQLTNAASFIAT